MRLVLYFCYSILLQALSGGRRRFGRIFIWDFVRMFGCQAMKEGPAESGKGGVVTSLPSRKPRRSGCRE